MVNGDCRWAHFSVLVCFTWPGFVKQGKGPLASVDKVLSRIKKPVYLLDMTSLSEYRLDAHPS